MAIAIADIAPEDMATAWSYPSLEGGVVQTRHARFCFKYGHSTNHYDGVLQDRCPRCGDMRENEPVDPDAPVELPEAVEAVETPEEPKVYTVYVQNIHTLGPTYEVETFADYNEATKYAANMRRLDEPKFDYWVSPHPKA